MSAGVHVGDKSLCESHPNVVVVGIVVTVVVVTVVRPNLAFKHAARVAASVHVLARQHDFWQLAGTCKTSSGLLQRV